MIILDLLALSLAVLISIPLVVVATECFIVLAKVKEHALSPHKDTKKNNFIILMPAHNEAAIIETNLKRLLAQIKQPNLITVIADNCSDETAAIARQQGVIVIERSDENNRGKGYALAFGVESIKKMTTSPEVVIILDADCEITADSLHHLVDFTVDENRPSQAIYMMRPPENASVKQKVAGFAWLVKNKIRPLAINKLGFPVTLTGTGMAFPWTVLKELKLAHGNIVEDMQIGIDCTLNGAAPTLCRSAEVFSDFPQQQAAEKTQRNRWEQGHLQTIIQQVPVLLKQALLRKNWGLLALALDIGVPPLSLLVMLALATLMLQMLWVLLSSSVLSFCLLFTSVVFFFLMMMAIWWKYGRCYLSLKELCSIPFYIISKLSIYIAFMFKRQTEWVRTNRD